MSARIAVLMLALLVIIGYLIIAYVGWHHRLFGEFVFGIAMGIIILRAAYDTARDWYER